MVHYLRPHAGVSMTAIAGAGFGDASAAVLLEWWSVSATAGNQGVAVPRAGVGGECGGMPNLDANAAGLATKHAKANKWGSHFGRQRHWQNRLMFK